VSKTGLEIRWTERQKDLCVISGQTKGQNSHSSYALSAVPAGTAVARNKTNDEKIIFRSGNRD